MTTAFMCGNTGDKLFEHHNQHITPEIGTGFVIGERTMKVVNVIMRVVSRRNGHQPVNTLLTVVVVEDV